MITPHEKLIKVLNKLRVRQSLKPGRRSVLQKRAFALQRLVNALDKDKVTKQDFIDLQPMSATNTELK